MDTPQQSPSGPPTAADAGDAPQSAPAAPQPAAAGQPDAQRAAALELKRRLRLDQYRLVALAKSDPLAASLAFANAVLLDCAAPLGTFVAGALADPSLTTETIERVAPAADMLLRVHRQINRFAELEYRATALRQCAEKPPARNVRDPLATGSGFTGPFIFPSEDSTF